MQIVDRGNGVPLVLIPGIQGRWEYMRPAIEPLSRHVRVITFPLCGDAGSGCEFVPARGVDNFVDQIDAVVDDRGLAQAVIVGVSFGGLIALHYAAMRPKRTSALILVSTPGPNFRPTRRHALYARAPRLLGPLFLAEIPFRVGQELPHTFSDRWARWRFSWDQIKTFFGAPFSMTKMAARAMLIRADAARDAALVSVPTLIVTGERALDRVVPVDGSREYLRVIRDARWVPIERTGHLGYLTRPETFATIVDEFTREVASRRPPVEGDPHAA